MSRKAEMVATLGGKNIVEPLDCIAARGYGFGRVFDDFLSLSCHALANQEAEYLKVIKSYPNDRPFGTREADYFKEAFHAWQEALQVDYRDYLGEIYEARVTLGENGQFFTPESLCEMMAAITAEKLADNARVCDPACGSGRTLLAATRRNRMASFHGVDLDQRCVKMAALNLLCRNVNATVVWGNSISLKAYGGYEITRTPLGGQMEWFGENRATELIRAGLSEQSGEPKAETPKHPQGARQSMDDKDGITHDNAQYSLSL